MESAATSNTNRTRGFSADPNGQELEEPSDKCLAMRGGKQHSSDNILNLGI